MKSLITVLVCLLVGSQAYGAMVFRDEVVHLNDDDEIYWSVEFRGRCDALIEGGHFTNRIQVYDDSHAELVGGECPGGVGAGGNSRLTIRRGFDLGPYLAASGNATLNAFVSPRHHLEIKDHPRVYFHGDYTVDRFGGEYGQGFVDGRWWDTGQRFQFNLKGETAAQVMIDCIPEPSTIALLLIGVITCLTRFRLKR